MTEPVTGAVNRGLPVTERVHRSSLGPLVRAGVSVLSYPAWRYRGAKAPAPPHVKRRMLAHTVKRFQPGVFVESGTYRGDTVARVCRLVPRVISIELDPTLARLAQRRFADRSAVAIIQGDSAQELPKLLADIHEPALLWLDGHFSGGVTADGGKCPLMSELAAALSAEQPHVILVDDIRLLDGSGGYPTLEAVLADVDHSRHEAVVTTERDVLFIVPSVLAQRHRG